MRHYSIVISVYPAVRRCSQLYSCNVDPVRRNVPQRWCRPNPLSSTTAKGFILSSSSLLLLLHALYPIAYVLRSKLSYAIDIKQRYQTKGKFFPALCRHSSLFLRSIKNRKKKVFAPMALILEKIFHFFLFACHNIIIFVNGMSGRTLDFIFQFLWRCQSRRIDSPPAVFISLSFSLIIWAYCIPFSSILCTETDVKARAHDEGVTLIPFHRHYLVLFRIERFLRQSKKEGVWGINNVLFSNRRCAFFGYITLHLCALGRGKFWLYVTL